MNTVTICYGIPSRGNLNINTLAIRDGTSKARYTQVEICDVENLDATSSGKIQE